MKKLLYFTLFSIFLSSCAINTSSDLNNIITKNEQLYYNQHISFENIAGALKEFSRISNSLKYKNIENLKEVKNSFLYKIKYKISDNYPVTPSDDEIRYLNKHLNDIIKYIEYKKVKPNQYNYYINNYNTIFLQEIMK